MIRSKKAASLLQPDDAVDQVCSTLQEFFKQTMPSISNFESKCVKIVQPLLWIRLNVKYVEMHWRINSKLEFQAWEEDKENLHFIVPYDCVKQINK